MKKATEGGAGTRRPRRAYSTYPIQMRTPGSFLMISFLTVAFLLGKTSKLHNSALIPPHELSLAAGQGKSRESVWWVFQWSFEGV